MYVTDHRTSITENHFVDMNVELIDTHAHIDYPDFEQDRDAMIARAHEAGITYIVNVGPTVKGSELSVQLAARYPGVFAAVGIHPHDADTVSAGDIDRIAVLSGQKKVVAVGEIGLDYYKNYSGPENQRKLFRSLLAVAKNVNVPVIIHSRQADEDTVAILKEYMPLPAVIHCFSGQEQFLRDCLALGCMISFTGNITYKNAHALRQVVACVPLDRLMLETDAPYLSCEGHRGKRNEPFFVRQVAQTVALILQVPFEEVCKVTTANAKGFFHLP